MSVEFAAFDAATHLESASELLAAGHALHRQAQPLLPRAFEFAAAARDAITTALKSPHAGVVAVRSGRPVGYLLARLEIDYLERMAVVWPHGSALAEGEDAGLYRQMYAAAAERWVRNGFFVHHVVLPATDKPAIQAWFSLGFGRFGAYNWRDLTPLTGPEGEVVVRRVGPDAIDDEEALRNNLRRYNASSPILHPLLWRIGPEHDRTIEAERAGMADDRNAYFIAYRDGGPAGLMIFTPPHPGYTLTPDNAVYLGIAFVDEAARQGGVATALVNRGLAWAREQGYEGCTLSYYAPNLLGARFWQSNGWQPLSYVLERRIDERIAWARGAGEPP